MKTKIFALFGAATLLFSISLASPKNSKAAYPWSGSASYNLETEFTNALNEGPNLVNWMGHIWMYSLQTADCAIGGCGRDAYSSAFDGKTTQVASYGVLGMLGMGLKSVYDAPPPAHVPTYLASLSPARPVHASKGTDVLNFVLELWKISRNVAYLFITVILVTAGFLIMFRKQIDPYTEVSVVAALPKIIIALLLITFSYAISALILDVGLGVGGGLVKYIIDSLPGYTYQDINAIQVWTDLGADSFTQALWDAMKAADTERRSILNLGFPMIVNLIFNFALLSTMVALLMKLIMNYAKWFILTVTAPLLFLIGALPGMGEQINNWFGNFLAATLSFPATYLVLNIAMYIKQLGDQTPIPLTDPDIAFFQVGGIGTAVMADLIFFGLALIAKDVPDMVQELFIERPGDIEPRELTGALKKIPVIGGLIG